MGTATRLAACALLVFVPAPARARADSDEFKVQREEVFTFARKPRVTRAADRTTIDFAADGFCDATVAIEETGANPPRIVRHLASGVLGPNAPAPFRRDSLEQTLVWDGKEMEVFAGSTKYKESGAKNGRFRFATSVACDSSGRVYVTDFMNDRVQVFHPDGKHLQNIPTARTWRHTRIVACLFAMSGTLGCSA
jgi:hypothetical protein